MGFYTRLIKFHFWLIRKHSLSLLLYLIFTVQLAAKAISVPGLKSDPQPLNGMCYLFPASLADYQIIWRVFNQAINHQYSRLSPWSGKTTFPVKSCQAQAVLFKPISKHSRLRSHTHFAIKNIHKPKQLGACVKARLIGDLCMAFLLRVCHRRDLSVWRYLGCL